METSGTSPVGSCSSRSTSAVSVDRVSELCGVRPFARLRRRCQRLLRVRRRPQEVGAETAGQGGEDADGERNQDGLEHAPEPAAGAEGLPGDDRESCDVQRLSVRTGLTELVDQLAGGEHRDDGNARQPPEPTGQHAAGRPGGADSRGQDPAGPQQAEQPDEPQQPQGREGRGTTAATRSGAGSAGDPVAMARRVPYSSANTAHSPQLSPVSTRAKVPPGRARGSASTTSRKTTPSTLISGVRRSSSCSASSCRDALDAPPLLRRTSSAPSGLRGEPSGTELGWAVCLVISPSIRRRRQAGHHRRGPRRAGHHRRRPRRARPRRRQRSARRHRGCRR